MRLAVVRTVPTSQAQGDNGNAERKIVASSSTLEPGRAARELQESERDYRDGQETNGSRVKLDLNPINFSDSIEEAQDLATSVLPASLLVGHDAKGGSENHVAELARGEEVTDPLLVVLHLDVEAGRDDTALVEAADKLNNDFAAAVVVNVLELANVAVLLHALEELDDHLRGRADKHLALAPLLSVANGLEGIGQHGHANHLGEEKVLLRVNSGQLLAPARFTLLQRGEACHADQSTPVPAGPPRVAVALVVDCRPGAEGDAGPSAGAWRGVQARMTRSASRTAMGSPRRAPHATLGAAQDAGRDRRARS
eukprot:CAMPEP_0202104638 /NCGR_PEP_ID=MMETSP0965-20130614/5579_1 /ASSEMBLY_ACC=CAM_ASM_000507 /TAXON_ID=4773 /ORGANISM="Schizochytrium aggregatum, Strain ATCC28209" /LENGTH=310 /DNA_ID=CAMNT_0048673505 /DNA_START=60 /DNA_END=993 /DNA_ORIENTATION=+